MFYFDTFFLLTPLISTSAPHFPLGRPAGLLISGDTSCDRLGCLFNPCLCPPPPHSPPTPTPTLTPCPARQRVRACIICHETSCAIVVVCLFPKKKTKKKQGKLSHSSRFFSPPSSPISPPFFLLPYFSFAPSLFPQFDFFTFFFFFFLACQLSRL